VARAAGGMPLNGSSMLGSKERESTSSHATRPWERGAETQAQIDSSSSSRGVESGAIRGSRRGSADGRQRWA
jgi:hypothetical protein